MDLRARVCSRARVSVYCTHPCARGGLELDGRVLHDADGDGAAALATLLPRGQFGSLLLSLGLFLSFLLSLALQLLLRLLPGGGGGVVRGGRHRIGGSLRHGSLCFGANEIDDSNKGRARAIVASATASLHSHHHLTNKKNVENT